MPVRARVWRLEGRFNEGIKAANRVLQIRGWSVCARHYGPGKLGNLDVETL